MYRVYTVFTHIQATEGGGCSKGPLKEGLFEKHSRKGNPLRGHFGDWHVEQVSHSHS